MIPIYARRDIHEHEEPLLWYGEDFFKRPKACRQIEPHRSTAAFIVLPSLASAPPAFPASTRMRTHTRTHAHARTHILFIGAHRDQEIPPPRGPFVRRAHCAGPVHHREAARSGPRVSSKRVPPAGPRVLAAAPRIVLRQFRPRYLYHARRPTPRKREQVGQIGGRPTAPPHFSCAPAGAAPVAAQGCCWRWRLGGGPPAGRLGHSPRPHHPRASAEGPAVSTAGERA